MSRALSIVTVLLVAAAAHAQGAGGTPQISYEAITSAPQGTWAEYETTMKGQQQKLTMRYALVEKSAKKMVLEVDGQTPMGALVMRMELSPGDAPNSWKMSGASMSMGGAPPRDMPVPATAPPIKKGELGKVIGHGAVKTAVGTFECKQYESTMENAGKKSTIKMWMSDKVGPVGLVKQELDEAQLTTILTATGTGAKSKMPPADAKPAGGEAAPAKPATEKPAKK
jgi:hypothetical protein